MERLTSVLANKIIEISASSGDDVRNKLDKVNRFRDFTQACQSLVTKYPEIEDEFIRMVEQNDFDTRTASSRVDSVIRFAETPKSSASTPQIIDDEPINEIENENIETEIFHDYEIENQGEAEIVEYTDFEEHDSPEEVIEMLDKEEAISEPTDDNTESEQKQKIRRIIQIIGIVIAVIILIFIIKFVLIYWKTILYILGGIALVAILVWIVIKRNKK